MSRLWHQRYQRSDSTAATGRDDLAVEEGFPSLPSPRRGLQTANQRGAGAKAFHKGQHGCQRQAVLRCRSNVMCHRFAGSPAIRQDASKGSSYGKRARPLGTQLHDDIQQHAMARIPLDSVVSIPYDSSIEHAFVFAGRPKLLAAGAAWCKAGGGPSPNPGDEDERSSRCSWNSDSCSPACPVDPPLMRRRER